MLWPSFLPPCVTFTCGGHAAACGTPGSGAWWGMRGGDTAAEERATTSVRPNAQSHIALMWRAGAETYGRRRVGRSECALLRSG